MESQDNPNQIILNQITFALPGQKFDISCSIAAEERLPVVTEFVLRIISVCKSLSPQHIKEYFGFNDKELNAVIQTLVRERLVDWDEGEGSLELTEYAKSKFEQSSDDLPRFFKIISWEDLVAFDLISFSPANPRSNIKKPGIFVELFIHDKSIQANSIRFAESAFQQHFDRIYTRNGSQKKTAQIYKISHVIGRERFFIQLNCNFFLNTEGSFEINRDAAFEEDEERDDGVSELNKIAESVSDVLHESLPKDNDFLEPFIEIFDDDLLRSYIKGDIFDFGRYIQEVHIDRKKKYPSHTDALIGNLYLSKNRKLILAKLREACGISSASQCTSNIRFRSSVCWIAPQSKFWARTLETKRFVEDANKILQDAGRRPSVGQVKQIREATRCDEIKVVIPVDDDLKRSGHIYRGIFTRLAGYQREFLGGSVEIFLHPTQFVCCLYHYFMNPQQSISIPIGFISTDPRKIETARKYVIQGPLNETQYVGLLNQKKEDFETGESLIEEFSFLNYSVWP